MSDDYKTTTRRDISEQNGSTKFATSRITSHLLKTRQKSRGKSPTPHVPPDIYFLVLYNRKIHEGLFFLMGIYQVADFCHLIEFRVYDFSRSARIFSPFARADSKSPTM